jgi:asparagine synthase (glutamine-hydrolysing)
VASQEEYWHPLATCPAQLPDTDHGWIEGVRASLDLAVQRRLRGLGIAGAMVSGGLDSSAVAALAQRKLESRGERLATFSAIDSANPCHETGAIHEMLNAFPFDAATVDVQQLHSLESSIHQHLEEMREPFDGSATLISAIYATAAGRKVRWVMDGIPADNLYTAGGLFRQLAGESKFGALWREARALHVAEGALYPTMQAVHTLLGSIVPMGLRGPWDALRDRAMYRKLRRDSCISNGFADKVQLRKRFRIYRRDMRETRIGKAAGAPHTIMTAAYITAGIERYNRIANFHGVEPRHPFLDRDLIELHAWLPLSLRLHDGHQKWALRAAMQDLLPSTVAWRRGKEHLGYLFNDRFWRSWESYSTCPAALKAFITLNDATPVEPPPASLLAIAWLKRRAWRMKD